MSIATIHYLSMNVRRGTTASDGSVGTGSETFTFTRLHPSTAYTITWGGGSPTTSSVTSSAGVNEVQLLTLTGAPTSGTFVATIAGIAIPAVDIAATVAAFQAAVDTTALEGDVTVGGSAGAWTLTFAGIYAGTNVAATTTVNTFVGGTSPNVVITTPTPGVAPGSATATHTYSAGTYTITVTDTANGLVWSTQSVTAA